MTSEREPRKGLPDLGERLRQTYMHGLEVHARIKPELDQATASVLQGVKEAFSELFRTVAENQSEEIMAIIGVPGGRSIVVRNLKASALSSFNFQRFPIKWVVGDLYTTLFRLDDKIEIGISDSDLISIHSPDATRSLNVDYRPRSLGFSASIREKSGIRTRRGRRVLPPLAPGALITFSKEKDSLEKALAVSELVQCICQIVNSKLKTPTTP